MKNVELERVGDDLGVVGDMGDLMKLLMVRDGEVVQRKDAIAGLLCGDENGGEDEKRMKEEDKDESAGQRVKKEWKKEGKEKK